MKFIYDEHDKKQIDAAIDKDIDEALENQSVNYILSNGESITIPLPIADMEQSMEIFIANMERILKKIDKMPDAGKEECISTLYSEQAREKMTRTTVFTFLLSLEDVSTVKQKFLKFISKDANSVLKSIEVIEPKPTHGVSAGAAHHFIKTITEINRRDAISTMLNDKEEKDEIKRACLAVRKQCRQAIKYTAIAKYVIYSMDYQPEQLGLRKGQAIEDAYMYDGITAFYTRDYPFYLPSLQMRAVEQYGTGAYDTFLESTGIKKFPSELLLEQKEMRSYLREHVAYPFYEWMNVNYRCDPKKLKDAIKKLDIAISDVVKHSDFVIKKSQSNARKEISENEIKQTGKLITPSSDLYRNPLLPEAAKNRDRILAAEATRYNFSLATTQNGNEIVRNHPIINYILGKRYEQLAEYAKKNKMEIKDISEEEMNEIPLEIPLDVISKDFGKGHRKDDNYNFFLGGLRAVEGCVTGIVYDKTLDKRIDMPVWVILGIREGNCAKFIVETKYIDTFIRVVENDEHFVKKNNGQLVLINGEPIKKPIWSHGIKPSICGVEASIQDDYNSGYIAEKMTENVVTSLLHSPPKTKQFRKKFYTILKEAAECTNINIDFENLGSKEANRILERVSKCFSEMLNEHTYLSTMYKDIEIPQFVSATEYEELKNRGLNVYKYPTKTTYKTMKLTILHKGRINYE